MSTNNLRFATLIRKNGDLKSDRLDVFGLKDSAGVAELAENLKIQYYALNSDLPTISRRGRRAFVNESRNLYVSDGTNWQRVTLDNSPPSVAFDSSTYYISLDSDASIRLVTSDSDDLNLTYSYTLIPSNIVDSSVDVTIDSSRVTISTRADFPGGNRNFKIIGSVNDGINLITDSADIIMDVEAVLGLTKSTNVISELGGDVVFTLETTGYPNGTEFPYTISGTGITAGDINQSLTGVMSVLNNEATLTVNAVSDFTSEGNETLLIDVAGFTESVTIADSSGTPSYSLSSSSAINENANWVITLTYANHPGGNVDFTVSNYGDITYNSGATSYSNGSGYWTLSSGSGTATFNFTANADYVTEGTEYLTMTLTGKGVSRQITINDTTKTPAVTNVTASASTVNEGSSVTYTVTTENAPNNWRVYWRLLGTATANDISSPTISNYGSEEGYITISNNSASLTVTTVADNTTEGSETVIFDVTRLANTSNTNYATYNQTRQATCSINDTSQDPVYAAGTGLSGSDISSTITATTTQIFNVSYSANSSVIPATSSAMQPGDWVRIYTDFYSAERWCQVYDVSGGNTYVSPGAQIYNGWNNKGYTTNASYGKTWKSWSRTTTSMSASERTGRVAFLYSQGSTTGSAERGILQMANVNMTAYGQVNISGTNASQWQVSTGHGYGFDTYNDVTSWTNMGTSTVQGRWNCISGNVPGATIRDNTTGVLGNPGPGNQFYADVRGQSTSQIGKYWLRSPEFTLSSSYLLVSFQLGRRGANMGTLTVYWIPS